MTDLIASLADSIVALINASPRSPTKEEIAYVIAPAFADQVCCGNYDNCTSACYHRGFHAGQKTAPIVPLPYKDVDPTIFTLMIMDKVVADLRATTGIDSLPRADCQGEAVQEPLLYAAPRSDNSVWQTNPAPSVSKAMLDARDAIRASSAAMVDLNMLGCAFVKHKPDGTSELATQEALDELGHAAFLPSDHIDAEIARLEEAVGSPLFDQDKTASALARLRARKVRVDKAACPLELSGCHDWHYHEGHAPAAPCRCGAIKP